MSPRNKVYASICENGERDWTIHEAQVAEWKASILRQATLVIRLYLSASVQYAWIDVQHAKQCSIAQSSGFTRTGCRDALDYICLSRQSKELITREYAVEPKGERVYLIQHSAGCRTQHRCLNTNTAYCKLPATCSDVTTHAEDNVIASNQTASITFRSSQARFKWTCDVIDYICFPPAF